MDVRFAADGMTERTVTGSVVDANTTVNSLYFGNQGTQWHVLEIPDAVLLQTIASGTKPSTGIFRSGNPDTSSSGRLNQVAIKGDGELRISGTTVANLTFAVSSDGRGGNGAMLDLSELATLQVTLNGTGTAVQVGGAMSGYGRGTLRLAQSSTLVAQSLQIGYFTSGALADGSLLELGANSSLNFDVIQVGAAIGRTGTANVGFGAMKLASGVSDAAVRIRGKAGGATRADLYVGVRGASAGAGVRGEVDLRGTAVNALLGQLVVGSGATSIVGGGTSGAFRMDEGSADAFVTRIGQSSTSTSVASATSTGTLEVGGGSFISGSIHLAENLGTAKEKTVGVLKITGGMVDVLIRTQGSETSSGRLHLGSREQVGGSEAVEAHVELSGGTLRVAGGIVGSAESAVTSSIHLNGGRLDLRGTSITNLTEFRLESGTLVDLGEYNAGATLTKTTGGTLVMEGTHRYTGATDLAAGVTRLEGSLTSTSALSVRTGATLEGNGASSVTTTGAFLLESGATWRLSLNAAADFDRYVVGTTAQMEGGLLELQLGYAPEVGTEFHLLTSTDLRSGTFASINGQAADDGFFTMTHGANTYGFRIMYDDHGVRLLVVPQAVPEPSVVFLLGVAGMAGFWGTRSRRRGCASA